MEDHHLSQVLLFRAQSMSVMPYLYELYHTKLLLLSKAFWRLKLNEAMAASTGYSQSLEYNWETANFLTQSVTWNENEIKAQIEAWNNNCRWLPTDDGSHHPEFNLSSSQVRRYEAYVKAKYSKTILLDSGQPGQVNPTANTGFDEHRTTQFLYNLHSLGNDLTSLGISSTLTPKLYVRYPL